MKNSLKKNDSIWCDLFWDYSIVLGENEEFKIKSTVDKPLLNFIKFITEMLYYQKNNEGFDFNFTTTKRIYKSIDNLNFLFSSFDLFVGNNSDFKNKIHSFFESLFSNTFKENKIALFEKQVNLFENCIDGSNFEHKEKLLLYAILYYQIKNNVKLEVTDNLKDYIRVIRNFIFRINQIKKDDITPELRVSQYKNIIETIHIIYDDEIYHKLPEKTDLFKFRTENIGYEIDKAKYISQDEELKKYVHKLEDHHYFRGGIHNVDFLYKEKVDYKLIVDAIYNIWGKLSDSLITRSLLSIGDYSVFIGNSSLGNLYFFGNGSKWQRILAGFGGNDDLEIILKQFLLEIISPELVELPFNEKLNYLIEKAINEKELEDWIYYFLKYPQITTNRWNIYAFKEYNDNGFRIEYINGTSVRSNHIDIMNKAVLESQTVEKSKLYNWSWVNNAYEEPLYFKNQIKLYPRNNYWDVEIPKELELNNDNFRITHVKSSEDYTYYKLKSDAENDLVQVAIQFINKI